MNFFYEKFLNIKSKNLVFVIVFVSIVMSLILGFLSVLFSPIRNIGKDTPFYNHILYFITYFVSIYLSYFFMNFFSLVRYRESNTIKKNILDGKEEIITTWEYNYKDWYSYKNESIKSINKFKKKKIKYFIILIILFIILFLTLQSEVSSTLISTFIFFILIFNIRDFEYENWKKTIQKEKATIVFSKLGFVISELYTSPFNIKTRKLVGMKYDQSLRKIFFEFKVLIIGTGENMYNDEVITENVELPIPIGYKLEVENLRQIIQTYISIYQRPYF